MAKQVVSIRCPKCSELFRSKLKRGVPVKSCPSCGWTPTKKGK